MLIVLATLLAVTAFVILIRLLWLSGRPGRYSTMITLAAVLLVMGLAVLAASGRLHWLAAVGAALLPFMRQGLGLLRYVPLLRSLGGRRDGREGREGREQAGTYRRRSGGAMSRSEAIEILGLGTQPTREEVLAAHRRLIQKLHPDRGGSNYLAQQLNEAKDRLLEDA
jgi:DnaJ homolog subfamily C member 19